MFLSYIMSTFSCCRIHAPASGIFNAVRGIFSPAANPRNAASTWASRLADTWGMHKTPATVCEVRRGYAANFADLLLHKLPGTRVLTTFATAELLVHASFCGCQLAQVSTPLQERQQVSLRGKPQTYGSHDHNTVESSRIVRRTILRVH